MAEVDIARLSLDDKIVKVEKDCDAPFNEVKGSELADCEVSNTTNDDAKLAKESDKGVSNVPETTPRAIAEPSIPSIPDVNVKHPLMYTWVLWYCKSDRVKKWEDCLKEVASFDTVEDFWSLYNHIQLASGLPMASDYYLFKKGIQPMWEDTTNVNGGRWLIQIDRTVRNDVLDIYWLELLMAMTGEQFEDGSDSICGAVVNIRNKGDKISLWTRSAADEPTNKRIGEILKHKLNIQGQIGYEAHKDTSQKTNSTVKKQLHA